MYSLDRNSGPAQREQKPTISDFLAPIQQNIGFGIFIFAHKHSIQLFNQSKRLRFIESHSRRTFPRQNYMCPVLSNNVLMFQIGFYTLRRVLLVVSKWSRVKKTVYWTKYLLQKVYKMSESKKTIRASK